MRHMFHLGEFAVKIFFILEDFKIGILVVNISLFGA